MITPFKVDSTRIRDINLPVGHTVGQLQVMLHNNGYDVQDARVIVNRANERDRYTGSVQQYQLQPGDTVEFVTRKCELPNIEQQTARCKRASEHTCCDKHEPCVCGNKLKVGDLEVEACANGIIIRFAR